MHLMADVPLAYYAFHADTRTESVVILCPLVVIYLGIEKLFGDPTDYLDGEDAPGDVIPRRS